MTSLSFLFLTLSFLSLWVRRDTKIWASLISLSLIFALIAGNLLGIGLLFLTGLLALWLFYLKKPQIALFLALIIATTGFKLHIFPGFPSVVITPKFLIGLGTALLGLIPLAFLVPLAKSRQDWTMAFKGLMIGCAGIALLAIAATLSGAVHWNFKMPTFLATRLWSTLVLTSIPEEGFYRGFVQRELCRYFHDTRMGKLGALLLTSILFTCTHLYWSPNIAILGFVFLSSLLYGAVYLLSKKIESAIACHFLLNFIHMTFFTYHAM